MPSKLRDEPPWTEEGLRLTAAMAERGISRNRVAAAAGVDRKHLRDILAGKRKPGDDLLAVICKVVGANPAYVEWGRLPMLVEPTIGIEYASPRKQSASYLQPVAIRGVDLWLAARPSEISPDEVDWMKRIDWPHPETKLPEFFYSSMLALFREMRDFVPVDGAGKHNSLKLHAP